jgi:hypothetical protein
LLAILHVIVPTAARIVGKLSQDARAINRDVAGVGIALYDTRDLIRSDRKFHATRYYSLPARDCSTVDDHHR